MLIVFTATTLTRFHTWTIGSILQGSMYSILVITWVIICGCMNYFVLTLVSDNIIQPIKKPSAYLNAEEQTVLNMFDEKELSLCNGIDKPEMYLSIIGNIFDVTEAKKHYGAGSTYHIFVGRDNSRAFITGRFELEDISDDILTLPPRDVIGIQNWIKFYKKSYARKGKLIGRYYDNSGKLTPYGKQVKKILKQSEQDLANKAAIKHRFPDCNVEWDPQKGSKFWCTNQSGGIKRDWDGLPKQLFLPGFEPRCACIHENEVDALENIKAYTNCEVNEKICYVQPNKKINQGDTGDVLLENENNRNEL